MAHGQDHLHDARHAGGGLGVAEVRLHRAEPQRFGAVLAVGGEEGAWASIGSPRVVPVPWASTASTSWVVSRASARAWRMTRCCDRPFGAVRPLDAPSWLTAEPADDGEHLVAEAAGVREAHQASSMPTPSPQPVPSAPAAKALAAAVLGQAALAGELHERARRGHDRDAARDGGRALAGAQRPDRQVEGDEGRRARRVDGDGRALQAEGVADAAGDDAGRVAGGDEAADAVLGGDQQAPRSPGRWCR